MAARKRFQRRTERRANGKRCAGGRKCALGVSGEKLCMSKQIVPSKVLRIVRIQRQAMF